jgi:hypothetical protein
MKVFGLPTEDSRRLSEVLPGPRYVRFERILHSATSKLRLKD